MSIKKEKKNEIKNGHLQQLLHEFMSQRETISANRAFEGRKTVEVTVVAQRDDKTSITKRVQCFRIAYIISF